MKERVQEKLEKTIAQLPHEPGIYKYKNEEGTIIYIGKAKQLKNRVSSYFNKYAAVNRKTKKLVSEIRDIEYVVVNSEFDALLLENNLIKENQPKYNILLKDDKTYPYICVTNERFPRVFSTRNIENKSHTYFGPYASVKAMNTLLELIRQLYHIRTCSYVLSEDNVAQGKFKVCLEYHIQNCKGPCEGLQEESDYDNDIQQVINILKGNISPVKHYYKENMQEAAATMEFEKAAEMKNKFDLVSNFQNKSLVTNPNIPELEAYSIIADDENAYVNFIKITNGCITQTETIQIKKKLDESNEDILAFAILDFREKFNSAASKIITNLALDIDLGGVEATVPKIGDLKKLVDLSKKNALYFKKEKDTAKIEIQKSKSKNYALIQLKEDLSLQDLPRHIECFDNSNIQGTNPVSAMVCFIDGKPAKKEYRHYNIKTVVGPDDFASMYEVVYRRYKRLKEEEKPLPNLIVIDGGKGQLSSACNALKDLDLYGKIPIVGIAKRLEEIYFPGDSIPLHINKKSSSLALLQKARDEAHRFGITFHRQKRSNSSLTSALEEIPGIGKGTIEKLLIEFKSINNIKNASVTDISKIIGLKKAMLLKEKL
ncbi:excinuclease ABC subunit UvrC [Chondrinema litorale]|uniref:excinuclease ABC subunit UvrC n=1 Tax=Chondrinema litorale TaxID=2994555 RepID=UPI0025440802|nr:excinuclease ABC subunit UvrC [Chondrinema litorale]UZR94573.1 excinuclease ABC subunit UvrC [Chondrinema litorale]